MQKCLCGKEPIVKNKGHLVTGNYRINYHGMTHISCPTCHIDIIDWCFKWAEQTWDGLMKIKDRSK